MRNKRCPYNKTCNEENAKIEELFRFDCPKKPFQECLKYEELEHDAIPERVGPPDKHTK